MNPAPRLAAVALAAALGGCASAPATNPRDPFENFNRAVFTFNDKVDQVALKPAATVYKRVLPQFVQTGVGNFFGNLADAWSGVNAALQGKGRESATDFGRFALNSTVGVLGLIDIASKAGLEKHTEDFGQTLGVWGVPSGPYLMLPLLGPSTVRDTAALPLDWKGDIWTHKDPVRWRNTGIFVRAVDQRAAVLDAVNLIEEAALDRYDFIRDSFLQRRESRVFEGQQEKPYHHEAPSDEAAPQQQEAAPQPAPQETKPAPSEGKPEDKQGAEPPASR